LSYLNLIISGFKYISGAYKQKQAISLKYIDRIGPTDIIYIGLEPFSDANVPVKEFLTSVHIWRCGQQFEAYI